MPNKLNLHRIENVPVLPVFSRVRLGDELVVLIHVLPADGEPLWPPLSKIVCGVGGLFGLESLGPISAADSDWGRLTLVMRPKRPSIEYDRLPRGPVCFDVPDLQVPVDQRRPDAPTACLERP